MAGLSCALSGASCCVLPIYFEATRFLSGYCGAFCFIFCQVIIKECPDIYSSFSSSTTTTVQLRACNHTHSLSHFSAHLSHTHTHTHTHKHTHTQTHTHTHTDT